MAPGHRARGCQERGRKEEGGGGEAEEELLICGGSVVPKNIHYVLCSCARFDGKFGRGEDSVCPCFHVLVHSYRVALVHRHYPHENKSTPQRTHYAWYQSLTEAKPFHTKQRENTKRPNNVGVNRL